MANPLGWARTNTSNIVEPPEAKKNAGWNPGEPAAAEYLNWWMNEVSKRMEPITLSDANNALTDIHLFRSLIMTPTANRIITLPTTNVEVGATIEIHNLATAQKFTLEASGGADIASFQNGSMKLMALQNTPTLATHWRILDVYGGASPSFLTHRNGTNQLNITGNDQIEFNNDSADGAFDNNGNYDTTLFRFVPTVPGRYEIYTQINLIAITDGDDVRLSIHKNGTAGELESHQVVSGLPTFNASPRVDIIIDVVNFTDRWEVFVQNFTRDTSDLSGGVADSYFQGHRIGN